MGSHSPGVAQPVLGEAHAEHEVPDRLHILHIHGGLHDIQSQHRGRVDPRLHRDLIPKPGRHAVPQLLHAPDGVAVDLMALAERLVVALALRPRGPAHDQVAGLAAQQLEDHAGQRLLVLHAHEVEDVVAGDDGEAPAPVRQRLGVQHVGLPERDLHVWVLEQELARVEEALLQVYAVEHVCGCSGVDLNMLRLC